MAAHRALRVAWRRPGWRAQPVRWLSSTASEGDNTFSVDRSGLLGQDRYAPLPPKTDEKEVKKSAKTPLVEELHALIHSRGPLPVSEFMLMCMGHPEHGYYQQRPVFGAKGDFITAPEVSQMFGELLGVWVLATWAQCGAPEAMHVVELGPGRGALANDFLRTVSQHAPFVQGLKLHLVENSPQLREAQRSALGVDIKEASTDESDWTQSPTAEAEQGGDAASTEATADLEVDPMAQQSVWGITESGIEVHWHWGMTSVPKDAPIFVLANEFFDALPVNQFKHTKRGWCEVLVDIDFDPESAHHLRLVLAPSPSVSTTAFLGSNAAERKALVDRMETSSGGDGGETVSIDVSGVAATQPQSPQSDEQKALPAFAAQASVYSIATAQPKQSARASAATAKDSEQIPTGGVQTEPDPGVPLDQCVEVSPMSRLYAQQVAVRIAKQGGAALFVDYGEDRPQAATLQGVKNHKYCDVLEAPGTVDLSAHVDFSALRQAVALLTPEVQVFPLTTQGEFLLNMNIEARAEALCDGASEAEAKGIEDAAKRLVEEDQMGMLFKCMAMAQPGIGAPAGFVATDEPLRDSETAE